MKVVVDSSSLLSLVRYYLHFDKNTVLFDFIKRKIEQGEIIIIDKVYEECSYFAKGIVLSKLDYLSDKSFLKNFKIPYRTENMIAPSPAKFLRQIDNQFVNTVLRKQRNLTDAEYESQKNSYLENADMKIIILALNLIKDNEDEDIFNDNKLFKKIPAICKELEIKTMTLPELLSMYDEIKVEFI